MILYFFSNVLLLFDEDILLDEALLSELLSGQLFGLTR